MGSEALISIKRIEEYLQLEEKDDVKCRMPVGKNHLSTGLHVHRIHTD